MYDSEQRNVLVTRLGDAVERLSYSMEAHERRIVDGSKLADLTSTQLHYIDIVRHLGSPSVGDIALRLGVRKPTATNAVADLADRGFLEKQPGNVDRRRVLVTLTSKGAGVADLHDSTHSSYAERIVSSIGERDAGELSGLLERLLDSLDASNARGEP